MRKGFVVTIFGLLPIVAAMIGFFTIEQVVQFTGLPRGVILFVLLVYWIILFSLAGRLREILRTEEHLRDGT